MKLVIDRKVWMRGRAPGSLLTEIDGARQQCCVGICLTASGVPDESIGDNGEVGELEQTVLRSNAVPDWMKRSEMVNPLDYNDCPDVYQDCDEDDVPDVERLFETAVLERLYAINDDPSLSDTDREPQIAAIFAAHGVEVVFF